MSVAAIVLAHTRLDRVAELVDALTAAEIRVALHIDAKTKGTDAIAARYAGRGDVVFSPRISCEWGRFSLVEASLAAADAALTAWPETRHVLQLSGACLPVRPLSALRAHLDAHPETDFIEAVPAGQGAWVKDGLSQERFTLYFPFSWNRQRKLFDQSVAWQRRLGIRRTVPAGLAPHLGSQWWCLTATTLRAILTDPNRPALERYFRLTWIPDETFFQTLARKHGRQVESRSLTFHRFDPSGRPYLFYDDHLPLLRGVDAFFARKIWAGADGLYRTLLDPDLPDRAAPDPAPLEARIAEVETLRTKGRPGLLMQGRLPTRWHEAQPATAAPYAVFDGFDRAMPGFQAWLSQHLLIPPHGRLFGPGPAAFAGGGLLGPGCLSAAPKVRDYHPIQWLVSLIWQERAALTAFLFEVGDNTRLASFIVKDPNARIYRLGGYRGLNRIERALEMKHATELDAPEARARLWATPRARFAKAPETVLAELITAVRADFPDAAPALLPVPSLEEMA